MARSLYFLLSALFLFCACDNQKDSLKNTIVNINRKCPIECEKWTVDSLGLSKKGEIVYFCNSTNNADYMIMLKSKKDSVRNALIDNLNNKNYENSAKLIQLCKKYNAGLVYKFYSDSTKETIVIKVPVEKLISDPSQE